MQSTRSRAVALVMAILLVAACGQKPNVAQVAAGDGYAAGGGAAIDPATGEAIDGAVDPATGAPLEGTVDPATEGATGGGGATGSGGGATGGGATGGSTGGGGGGGTATAGNRTGITDTEIRIGIHAPVTGAAPIPQNSFEEGKEVFWKTPEGKVGSRTVRVFFEDDKFDPATAVQKCKKMVEVDKVFLLIGGGGADQITACAKYANQVGVPYLSAGVNQTGLEGLKTYFALSLTYSQQSPIIASLLKNKLGKSKIGIVVADTPSFADAQASFTKAAQEAGLEVVRNAKINKNASASETLAEAGAQQRAGAEAVYILTSPTVFIQFAQSAANQGYNPQYVGPGITAGLNTVANVGCPGIGEARFLSPFFQLDDPAAEEYKKAYRDQNGKEGDDIGFALWGLSAVLGEMLKASGEDLGRGKFMATLNSGQPFSGGVYSEVKYAPGKPFGGSAASLLRADCGARRYVTEAKNVTGF